MYRIIAIIILMLTTAGCVMGGNSIEPIDVIRTEFSKSESEELLYRAWKPAYDMTIDGVTVPRTKINNFEDFMSSYDFSYVDEFLVEDIYFRSMASYDENNEMLVDENGYIVFDIEEPSMYIPTIYDERVEVVESYYEEQIFDSDHSHLNELILTIREESTDEEDELKGFSRTSIFEKNEEGRWILMRFSGVLGQTPSVP